MLITSGYISPASYLGNASAPPPPPPPPLALLCFPLVYWRWWWWWWESLKGGGGYILTWRRSCPISASRFTPSTTRRVCVWCVMCLPARAGVKPTAKGRRGGRRRRRRRKEEEEASASWCCIQKHNRIDHVDDEWALNYHLKEYNKKVEMKKCCRRRRVCLSVCNDGMAAAAAALYIHIYTWAFFFFQQLRGDDTALCN